jgi:hypothetical protein
VLPPQALTAGRERAGRAPDRSGDLAGAIPRAPSYGDGVLVKDRNDISKGATMAEPTTSETPLELAYRANDGVEVTLLWSRLDDRLTVQVSDAKSGDFLELEAQRDNALQVFHHPYAHAAFMGIDYRAAVRQTGDAIYA